MQSITSMNKSPFLLACILCTAHNMVVTHLFAMQAQKIVPTSIPAIAAIAGKPGRLDKDKAVEQFATEMHAAAQENLKIPQKDSSIFRIMTYNVHFWRNPRDTQNVLPGMIAVIAKLNPDIVILQEALPQPGFGKGKEFANSEAMQALQKIGFMHFSSCNTLSWAWFGNIVASKVPLQHIQKLKFDHQGPDKHEQRCYIGAQVTLPNQQPLYLYGTHLEVKEDDTLRAQQIAEIIENHESEYTSDNLLIAGDFNATRTSSALEPLREYKFTDAFTKLGWQHPALTNWTGQEIDFIFLAPGWNLPLAGSYVYYDATSDHLPLILDIALQTPKPAGAAKAPKASLALNLPRELTTLHTSLLALAAST